MNISKALFGSIDGVDVDLFTLKNDNGVIAKITNYGGTVTSLVVPDRQGGSADIVCGFDTLDGYFAEAYKAKALRKYKKGWKACYNVKAKTES